MVDSLEVVKILLVWEASTRKLFLKVDWEETFWAERLSNQRNTQGMAVIQQCCWFLFWEVADHFIIRIFVMDFIDTALKVKPKTNALRVMFNFWTILEKKR